MGLLDRLRRRPDPEDGPSAGATPAPVTQPVTQPAMPPAVVAPPAVDRPSLPDQREWLDEAVADGLRPGFRGRAELREQLVETFVEDDDLDLTEADVDAALERGWHERLALEAGWDGDGDEARLAAAFAELEAAGILARMDFTCCQSCGHAEIGDELPDGPDGRIAARGYVFFHQQDTERLAPGGSDLYLAFGGFGVADDVDPALAERARAGDEQARAEVVRASEASYGREVVAALERQGLHVDWDGTHASRIRVVDLDWRRRVPTA